MNGRVQIARSLPAVESVIGISFMDATPSVCARGCGHRSRVDRGRSGSRTAWLKKRGDAFRTAVGLEVGRVDWRCSQEFPGEYIAREARAADLVVIGREREAFDPYVFPEPGAFLLRVGRPVLAGTAGRPDLERPPHRGGMEGHTEIASRRPGCPAVSAARRPGGLSPRSARDRTTWGPRRRDCAM